MAKTNILDFLKRVSKRVGYQRGIQNLMLAGALGLGASFILIVISLFVTISYTPEKCAGIVGVSLLAGIVYSIIKFPKKQEIARLVDETGLQERVSTALMLLESTTPLSNLQREDTLKHIKNYDIKSHFPIRISMKRMGINVALVLMCMIACMIPTSAKQNEKALRNFTKQKEEIVKEIEEAEKVISQEEKLSEPEKKIALGLLNKAAKEVSKLDKQEEIEKAMERLDKKIQKASQAIKKQEGKDALEKISKDLTKPFKDKIQQKTKEDLESLSKALEKNELTKDIAKQLEAVKDNHETFNAINDEEKEQLAKALEELKKQLENLSQVEKEALANTLTQAASHLNSQEVAASLQNASGQISQGTLNTKALQATLQNLKDSASGNQNSNSSGQSSSGQGNSQGNGSGQGNAQNSGQGRGQGSGNGNGGGWNKGSNIGHETLSEGNTKTPEENITSQDIQISGNSNGKGQIKQGEIPYGMNIAGKKVDYHSVVGDYTDEALEKVESAPVPNEMKDIVRDYFEAINQ